MWHKKYQNCKNCESIRFKHKARGYCYKCYPIILKNEKAEQWNFSKPETLKSFPKGFVQLDEKTFERIKKGVISQLQQRLELFKIREKRLKGDVFGIDIEYGLNRIAKYCRVKEKDLFHNSANTFDHNFTMEQKKIIYEFIDRIEQNITWQGIDWNDVLFKENW